MVSGMWHQSLPPCLAWGPTINKYLKHRGNGGIVWNGAIIERWCVAFFWWKMPLGEQGSLHTLNANKSCTKPPADLNTKAQLANWQVTSTQASWAERACVPADLRILRYLPGAIQEICQPYLQNQPIRQSSCDTTYLSMFSQKTHFEFQDSMMSIKAVWLIILANIPVYKWVVYLGSVQSGQLQLKDSSGRPGQLLWFSKLRYWNHASGLVSVQFWPDKFTKSWNLTT